jgi:hypothetical protein
LCFEKIIIIGKSTKSTVLKNIKKTSTAEKGYYKFSSPPKIWTGWYLATKFLPKQCETIIFDFYDSPIIKEI